MDISFPFQRVSDDVTKMSDFAYGKQGDDDERGKMENRAQGERAAIFKRLDSVQDPGKRYVLKDRIGNGVCGDVYEGIDQQAGKGRAFMRTDVKVRTKIAKCIAAE